MYNFSKIISKNDFPYRFKKIIVRYRKVGYNIDTLRRTVCLIVNPVKVNTSAYLFDCTTVGRVVLGRAYRGLTGGFLLLWNFSVAISVSPHICFILVLI